jgi:hypothetical protein
MRMRVGLTGALIVLAALAAPATGSASTTIGSSLVDPFFNGLNCNAFMTGCTASNGPLMPVGSRASGGLNSPINGIVVRWRLKSGPTPDVTSLRILRPGSSTTRSAAGTSTPETPTASSISTFDTRLPIAAGDTIGVDSKGPPVASLATADMRYWAPALPDNGAPAASSSFANAELLVNADIEADGDHDLYGDETQDGCPLEPATHDGCLLTIDLGGKGGSLTGPGIDCPGDCSEPYADGTIVHLTADPDKGFAVHEFAGGACHGYPGKECDMTMFTNETVVVSFADVDAPQTTITKGPGKTTSKRKVKFKFRSDEPHSTFRCALDKETRKKTKVCTSPYKVKVKPGRHTFFVRAVDANQNFDGSPAKLRFKVAG